ncbi:MAG TPA: alpha/beta hydrolase [Gemmataceae bacterium]|nr:alpha/beta hydrolase [Gemmataceae bacterium]
MVTKLPIWITRLRPRHYGRKPPLILINGLAEQAESWYRNHRYWRRYFDVYMPNFLVYDGEALHRRIEDGLPISVDYLVEQLQVYLSQFVQAAPYHFVASSLGGKVAVEFATRYPKMVGRMILLCPSGMGDEERLPIIEGVRKNDVRALAESVFYRPARHADGEMVRFYKRQFPNRRWQKGLLRTVNGTKDHTVRDRMKDVQSPTLVISGRNDRICDPKETATAAAELRCGHFLMIPRCGHAPQIEKAWLINRLVVHFLTHPRPSSRPRLSQLLLGSAK